MLKSKWCHRCGSPVLSLQSPTHLNDNFSAPVGSLCHTHGVVRRLSSIFLRVSSVSTITTTNNEAIKSILSANVYHVSGLCLLGIGGAPYIVHKIMAQNHIFTFLTSSLKQPAGGASYYIRRMLKLRPS